MCGIAGLHLKKPDYVKHPDLLERFINCLAIGIENRGRVATGMVCANIDGGWEMEKVALSASEFVQARDPIPAGTRTILLHTRYDTKGSPKNNKNNHPVQYKSVFTIHNGSIHNDDKLFKEYKLKRLAQVDSEVISALFNKFDLLNAKDVLQKLKGSLAIASIDPEKHPGSLVLAKGDMSPLHVLENDDFIVWASTQGTIRDAWAATLGTPPSWNKFKAFASGEFWIVTDDKVEKDRFREAEVYSYQRPHQHKSWNGWDDDDNDWGGWPVNAEDPPNDALAGTRLDKLDWTRRDLTNDVAALRGAGKGIARLMSLDTDKQDMKGCHEPYRWIRCLGCKVEVIKEDIRGTLAWGKMCEDCYLVCLGTEHTKEWSDELGTALLELKEDHKVEIENWSKLEAHVHASTLAEMGRSTGLDARAIDWLVFRVPQTYLDLNENINTLASSLDALYQETAEEMWTRFGANASGPRSSVVVKPQPTFVACSKHHNINKASDVCPKCKEEMEEAQVKFEANRERTDNNCDVCKEKGRKQPGRFKIGNFVWCGKHFNTCHSSNCLFDSVNKGRPIPVAIDAEGNRVCHWCVRGTKGCLFDGEHENKGVSVVKL